MIKAFMLSQKCESFFISQTFLKIHLTNIDVDVNIIKYLKTVMRTSSPSAFLKRAVTSVQDGKRQDREAISEFRPKGAVGMPITALRTVFLPDRVRFP